MFLKLQTFPIVYTIMQGRTTEDYTEVLSKICNIVQIHPSTAVADFERAERNALQIVFPGIKVIGCFFHYSQTLVHNAKKHKILKGEKKELGYGAVRLLISLALLPEALIEEGFSTISTVIFANCEYLEPFFAYYSDTWIKGFKPESFCVYKQYNRTNKISERHNRELKESLNKHSTIVAFLGVLLTQCYTYFQNICTVLIIKYYLQ
ncbi:uncharacterized protein [Temnothorax nylanderi]|uniref:uncharacterized protein n=1 Tax=Temnothorax nylanderi TaxID=102681 RepID=UPI003A8B0F8F